MKIAVVTTFNDKLYHEYAQNFLQSFYKHCSFDLYVYSEEPIWLREEDKHEKLTIYNTYDEIPSCKEFADRHKDDKFSPPSKFKTSKKYAYLFNDYKSFRHMAVRFSYKVYAYSDFILNKADGYDAVIGLDADTLFFNTLDENFIKTHIHKDKTMMAYLGRGYTQRGIKYHSECCFLYFNLKHEQTQNYLADMKKYYDNDLIYEIAEQHDSFVWDHVRQEYEKTRGVLNHNIGDKGVAHVQARSCLAKVFDHLKGRIPKERGYSLQNKYAAKAKKGN